MFTEKVTMEKMASFAQGRLYSSHKSVRINSWLIYIADITIRIIYDLCVSRNSLLVALFTRCTFFTTLGCDFALEGVRDGKCSGMGIVRWELSGMGTARDGNYQVIWINVCCNNNLKRFTIPIP